MLALLNTQTKFNACVQITRWLFHLIAKKSRKENMYILLYYLRLFFTFLAHRTVRYNQNLEKTRQKRKEDLKCATRQSYKESSV